VRVYIHTMIYCELQNNFVFHFISFILEFKRLIQSFNVIPIYAWRSIFLYFFVSEKCIEIMISNNRDFLS
jgi:hypothetical protein